MSRLAFLALASCAAPAWADITVNSAAIDTVANSLVGRQGSVAQTQDDPPLVPVSFGLQSQSAYSTAGPVAFVNPVNMPGTATVSVSRAHSIVGLWPLTPNPNYLVADALLSTDCTMSNLDGGSYAGSSSTHFEVNITVTGAAVPYTVTGNAAIDDTDIVGYAQIYPGILFIYNAVDGPFNYAGTLQPGNYIFRGGVTSNVPDDPISGPGPNDHESSRLRVRLILGTGGTPPCDADIGQQGGIPGPDGVLDNNDFIVFIDYFFAQNPLADRGVQGGLPGSDGLFDNNDFIVFIDQFFASC